MKRVPLGLLLGLAVILLARPATTEAGSCATPIVAAPVVQQTYVAPVYQAPAVAYVYPAIFVPTASYTVGLTGSDQGDRLEQLLRKIEGLEARLTQPANVLPLQQVSAAAASCVKCHSGPEPKGGYTLAATPTAADKALIAEKVLDGSMPPRAGLTKEQRRATVAELVK